MQDYKTYLRVNSILHLALMMGQIIFAAVCLAMTGKTKIVLDNTEDIFLIVVPAVTLFGIFVSGFMFKKSLETAVSKSYLIDKLTAYRVALIMRYAFLEAPSLLSIVAYLLTGNFGYILISGFIILYFIALRPTKDRLEKDLQLDYKQKEEVERLGT